jgi:hypothetical protein
MTTSNVENQPQENLLAYASPARVERGGTSTGVVSIIVGAALGLFVALAMSSSYGDVLERIRYHDSLFAGSSLMLLGFVASLLGHVTLVRGGILLLCGNPTAAHAHRTYVRMHLYGMLAVLVGLLWDYGTWAAQNGQPCWQYWPKIFTAKFFVVALLMLLYPMLVLKQKMFQRKPAGEQTV